MDLKAQGDLAVVTAARLSATFPYVTPLSRQPGKSGYHIADGGYYDNFGITTALEWFSRVHARLNLYDLVEKVILVEIRASPVARPEPQENSGWLYATLGPAITLWNVRNTSQRNHNEAAVAALKALLDQPAHRVPFERVAFELDTKAPLSWQLSRTEREAILSTWESATIREQRDKLECLWRTPPDQWLNLEKCDAVRPADLSSRSAAATVFEQARKAANVAPAKVPEVKSKMGL